MSADHQSDPHADLHRDQGHDEPRHEGRPGEFVVPEPDGVHSGVPFGDLAGTVPAHYAGGAGHGRRELDEGRGRSHTGGGGSAGTGGGGGRAVLRGMSLKRKLNLSLGLLTLVILLLGLVAVRTIDGISSDGIPELGHHADLARVSEAIKGAVFRMNLAQADYLLLDDEGARDEVMRLATRVREEIAGLKPLAALIESTTGTDVAAQQAALGTALERFETRFTAQVKSVAALRQDQTERAAALAAGEQALAERLDTVIDQARALAAAVWGSGTGPNAPAESGGRLELARALDRFTADLLQERVALQIFFDSHDPLLQDSARTAAAEFAARLDQLRPAAQTLGLDDPLAQLRKALAAYTAQWRETGARLTGNAGAVQDVAARIKAERETLTGATESIVALAEELTASAWHDIAVESAGLRATGQAALWLVGGAAGVGLAVGLLVLLTVPRPIVAAIEALMAGSHQIARGNLSDAVDVTSRDELGALADSFNQMRENLLALVQRIQRASVQLSSSINEIQAAATEQAASSAQQASAVNELSASLNEMSQSAATLVASSETVGRNVNEIAGIVTDSNHKSTQMMASMDAIGTSTRQTAERIKALNDKMDDINEAVSTISMVADQTTLLSLNASIEANKAGEMGKGFSVVAQEIRRLSDRSIDSAGNISGMVRDIQRATESSALAMDKSSEEIHHGVALVGDSSQALAAIHSAMERIQEQMTMILESVRAQAESARMVQTTSTEMLSSANMVSKAAGQTRSVTYELNAMATQLASAVSVFRV
ncbi:methyl-accepting chemotaxis protein [Lamprocystis purpurea]|uniref:methyl-accepting chemotaxis protein n=2 Tax=Lamprocystis TaxID=53452 RepID=UPI00037FD42A|nr:methyl-accepting chemotaxis protein [Lamprocystis purpurea]